jgi:hypothetical protein
MFPTGSSTPNERARLLIQKIVPVLVKLNQSISIAGHTDAAPFPGPDRTNWELSSDRANATRRLLVDGGFPDARVKSVIGDADRDPLLPADPLAAANRRIAILVLRNAPPFVASSASARSPARPRAAASAPVAVPPAARPPIARPPIAGPPVAGPPVAGPPVAGPPVAGPPVAAPNGKP